MCEGLNVHVCVRMLFSVCARMCVYVCACVPIISSCVTLS